MDVFCCCLLRLLLLLWSRFEFRFCAEVAWTAMFKRTPQRRRNIHSRLGFMITTAFLHEYKYINFMFAVCQQQCVIQLFVTIFFSVKYLRIFFFFKAQLQLLNRNEWELLTFALLLKISIIIFLLITNISENTLHLNAKILYFHAQMWRNMRYGVRTKINLIACHFQNLLIMQYYLTTITLLLKRFCFCANWHKRATRHHLRFEPMIFASVRVL